MTAADGAEALGILNMMTQGITTKKEKAAAKLTPVAGETGGAKLPMAPVSFPNDKPQENVEQAVEVIERQAQNLLDTAAALRIVAGMPPRDAVVVSDVKAKERAADQRAAEQAAEEAAAEAAEVEPADDIPGPTTAAGFLAQSLEAQAAVYGDEGTLKAATKSRKAAVKAAALDADVLGVKAAAVEEVYVGTDQDGADVYEPERRPVADPEPAVVSGKWVCPEHGQAMDAISRLKRAYRKCPVEGCQEFERP